MLQELKKRLLEKTTWAGLAAVITGASAFEYPWSAALIVVGVIGLIVPDAGGEV